MREPGKSPQLNTEFDHPLSSTTNFNALLSQLATMSLSTSKIFAVLIGIDNYRGQYGPGGAGNLRGCVNDVNVIKSFLENKAEVPTGNIHTLTSPLHSDPAPEKLPTKLNVVNLIKSVSTQAMKEGPDTLFYLHYSGHGARMPTLFKELNKGSHDEALCTLGAHLRDVEISKLLRSMTKKGLTVFVTFDCCHSGGADRASNDADGFRCPPCDPVNIVDTVDPLDYAQDEEDDDLASAEVPDDGASRNATVKANYFYAGRSHTLLAACQPTELAQERVFGDLNSETRNGTLTHLFITALNQLHKSETPITYDILMKKIDGLWGAIDKEKPQQPLLLGDRNRLIFDTKSGSSIAKGIQASVVATGPAHEKTLVTLNKGSSSGVGIGDIFQLYSSENLRFGLLKPGAKPAAEVEIHKVQNTKAFAWVPQKAGSDATRPEQGWIAVLTRPAKLPIVYFNTGGSDDLVTTVQDSWEKLFSDADASSAPQINLKVYASLDGTEDKFNDSIVIEISDNGTTLVFRDSNGDIMADVPSLESNDPELAEKLAHVLPRLCAYQRLANLNPQIKSRFPLDYEYLIEKVEHQEDMYPEYSDEEDEESANPGPSYDLKFRNKSTKKLFVTILNLQPAYGISQVMPAKGEGSREVQAGEWIPNIPLEIQPPALLAAASKQPGFKMRDTFKVLITTKAMNFSHYIQPDLEDWETWRQNKEHSDGNSRDGVVKEHKLTLDEFWVISKEIITTYEDLQGPATSDVKDESNKEGDAGNGNEVSCGNGQGVKETNDDDKVTSGTQGVDSNVTGGHATNGGSVGVPGVEAGPSNGSHGVSQVIDPQGATQVVGGVIQVTPAVVPVPEDMKWFTGNRPSGWAQVC